MTMEKDNGKNRDKDYGWRKQGKVMGGGGRRMGSSFPPS